MKKILITGQNSYIGNTFIEYILSRQDNFEYKIDKVSLRGNLWRETLWENYDVIIDVAGIAHVDVKRASEETKKKYYAINKELTIEVAHKARKEGVKQFIYLSSMIVYGNNHVINDKTQPEPENFYGDSKWQAEKQLMKMDSPGFKVVIVRPPFVYGKGSKGNYPLLAKLSRVTPVFPRYANKRSMIYIENLCEFLRLLITKEKQGIYHPQNREIVSTTDLVRIISGVTGHTICFTPFFNFLIKLLRQKQELVKKIFGDFYYAPELSVYDGMDYQIYSLEESLRKTEGK